MYKDLAKYWIGFVPVASLVGLGFVLAPSVHQIAQVGVSTWWDQRWLVVVALAAAIMALVAMTFTCARVLSAEPTKFAELLNNADWLSDAFSKYAVGQPYWLDSGAFMTAIEHCRTPDPQGGFDPRASAVNEVSARISLLSADLNAKGRFTVFGWTFALGVVFLAGGALTVLGSSSDDLGIITDPTPVTIHVPTAALAQVTKATGCQVPLTASAVAVGGTWGDPKLRLFGNGCQDGDWTPSPALHLLITKP